MNKSGFILVAVSLLCGATACSKLGVAAGSADCTGSAANGVILDIVRKEIIRLASEESDGNAHLSKAKIRATVQQLKLSLDDVRTTKNDPNSSKKFCTGTIKLVAPAEMVIDADDTRRMAGLNSIEDLADSANVEKGANTFSADIDYNVQPTDDGDKIFGEIEGGDAPIGFFAELTKDHLLKSAVANAKAEEDRLEAERNAAIDSANQEMAAATLQEAQANNKSAIDTIGAIWKAIPKPARDQMLPAQRAWIRKTGATCKVEAATAGGDENAMNVTRLNCETREQLARAEELRRFATESIQSQYDATSE